MAAEGQEDEAVESWSLRTGDALERGGREEGGGEAAGGEAAPHEGRTGGGSDSRGEEEMRRWWRWPGEGCGGRSCGGGHQLQETGKGGRDMGNGNMAPPPMDRFGEGDAHFGSVGA